MNLMEILRPECIKVPLENKQKQGAIGELVDLLNNNGLLTDRDDAFAATLTREKTRSTGIGSGIAIPHGKCRGVKSLSMAVGIANDPIDFESVDGKPVTIVILLVSPVDQTGPHIQALARISRIMLDEQLRGRLETATSARQVYDLLSAKERS